MADPQISPLWFVDRSRIVDGRGFCQRARALGYHLGPNGYGIARKATKLPLMTGIASHDGLAPILRWCADHDDLVVQGLQVGLAEGELRLPVPRQVVRDAVAGAQGRYWEAVKLRGFAYLEDDAGVMEVTREQNYLIEGLIWAWCLEVLPGILQRARILEVEVDDTYVIGCTCGLGDGTLSHRDHGARECQGVGLMCRPDFLAETRLTQEVEYHEFKTTSMDSITFRDKWEIQIQLFAATLDAERRLQRHVQSIYIHALIKGRRGGEYNPETKKYDGTIRQQSIFCYGYRKPANPPMEAEEWASTYEYVDEAGKNRRLPKTFQKAGVWELPEVPEEGMSKGEYWTTSLPPEVRRKQLMVLGPFSRQQQMVAHFIQEMLGEEARWRAGLWELYELAVSIMADASMDGDVEDEQEAYWRLVWPHEDYQALLNRWFPRSYECRRYGGRNRCQFEDVCLQREGWADPVGSGRFIERRPHHQDELDQAVARGLLLPEVGAADEVEMELP